MRVLAAFAAHELRTQLRSLRFRVVAPLYVGLSLVAPLAVHAGRRSAGFVVEPATHARFMDLPHALLSVMVAFAFGLDLISREREEGSFRVLAIAPMSSAGYLMRRVAASAALLLPLTAIPPCVMVGVTAVEHAPAVALRAFALPYVMHLLPLTVTALAMGVGFGTVAGGQVMGSVAAVAALGGGLAFANGLLARAHRRLEGPGEWLGMDALRAFGRGGGGEGDGMDPFTSSGAYDLGMAAESYFAQGALSAAVALGVLGLSVAYLRRTMPDVRPWVVPEDHPLRTMLRLLSGLRADLLPDPHLEARDRLALVLLGCSAMAIGTFATVRGERMRDLGVARFAAEESELPAPTPPSVVPLTWRVTAVAGRRGRITSRVEATVRNDGAGGAGHLAFALNPLLELRDVTATGRRVTPRRSWDRLALELDPPVPAGATQAIAFELEGAPGEVVFPIPTGALSGFFKSFHAMFGDMLATTEVHNLLDFSRTTVRRCISARRTQLLASDLFPVPRYARWELSAARAETGGSVVADESRFPSARVELDLALPGRLVLADVCGAVARSEEGRTRLASSCDGPLADYAVMGGPFTPLPAPADFELVAVLPGHEALAAQRLDALGEAPARAREAWPSLVKAHGLALLEWPPAFVAGRDEAFRGMFLVGIEPRRKLLLVPEASMRAEREADADSLAADIVASELLGARAIVPSEQVFFRHLFRQLALRRLGKASVLNATVDGDRISPLLQTPTFWLFVWYRRLPAILVDLEARVGQAAFQGSIEEFLGTTGPAGSARELLDVVERRSGVDLDRFYADHFTGSGVPLLRLKDVEFRKSGGTWEVVGAVVNEAKSGQAICALRLDSDGDPPRQEIVVEPGSRVELRFLSPARPRALRLDPDGVCFRQAVHPSETIVANPLP